MLLDKLLVANPTRNVLELTWLAPIYVVVRVEERAIGDHERHLVALVRDLEVAVRVNRLNLNLRVHLVDDLVLHTQQLNELLRHDVSHFDLADVQRRAIALPSHVVHHL